MTPDRPTLLAGNAGSVADTCQSCGKHWKVYVGALIFLLFFAFFSTWRDATHEAASARKDLADLRADFSREDAQLIDAHREIEQRQGQINGLLAAQTAITSKSPKDIAGTNEDYRAAQTRLQDSLGKLLDQGKRLQGEWVQQFNASSGNDRQFQIAKLVLKWHESVRKYLLTIPRGRAYLARFDIPVQQAGVPMGIAIKVMGVWGALVSDLARLNEFIADPSLGKP